MALEIWHVFAEDGSPERAFAQARQHPLMKGRVRYELMDPTTLYPSDQHAFLRSEDVFGVRPQPNKVSIAGANTNTCWAIRVLPQKKGQQRFMYFGLRRV